MAAESGSKWWRFGQKDEAEVTQQPFAEQSATAPSASSVAPLQQPMTGLPPTSSEIPPADAPERNWMINSPFGKVSWPRVHMPELPKPQLPKSTLAEKPPADANRNTWVEKDIEPIKPSPLEVVGQRTRAAWDRTVDVFTPGEKSKEEPSARVAGRDRPPVWKRMFGAGDPRTVEGPQTVTEWMAQERLDP
jgi:hypothetical protein